MQEDEPSEYITAAKFTKVALRLLKQVIRLLRQGMMQRANEDTLSRAFKRLDPEGKGYLLPDDLRSFLTTQVSSV